MKSRVLSYPIVSKTWETMQIQGQIKSLLDESA
jgi:hypothetical protein